MNTHLCYVGPLLCVVVTCVACDPSDRSADPGASSPDASAAVASPSSDREAEGREAPEPTPPEAPVPATRGEAPSPEPKSDGDDRRQSPEEIDATALARAEGPPGECTDADGDGWPACAGEHTGHSDCDDADPRVAPGAGLLCDGRDGDCNGEPDTEQENGCVPGVPDPNETRDTTPAVPRAPEPPWPDGCGDADDDGWPTCEGVAVEFQQDCDPSDPRVFPWAGLLCDGRDGDCNGEPDTEQENGCRPGGPSGEEERR
jgi:hypothetical protein